jgi:hypothetical protein
MHFIFKNAIDLGDIDFQLFLKSEQKLGNNNKIVKLGQD